MYDLFTKRGKESRLRAVIQPLRRGEREMLYPGANG